MACEGVLYQRFKKEKKINPWDTQTLPLKIGDEKHTAHIYFTGRGKSNGAMYQNCVIGKNC